MEHEKAASISIGAIVFIVLLVLKLTNQITIGWFWVFTSFIWVPIVLMIGIMLFIWIAIFILVLFEVVFSK